MNKSLEKNSGHSLIEIVVALAIFAVMLSVLMIFSANGITVLERTKHYTKALALLEEGETALRDIESNSWNHLRRSQSTISTSSGVWELGLEGEIEKIGNYQRTVFFSDVYRDVDHNIVNQESPAATIDIMSKYASLKVNWVVPDLDPIELERTMLLTHYNASDWQQNDWSLGGGVSIWSGDGYFESGGLDVSNYGVVSLPELASSSYEMTSFLESAAFYIGAGRKFTVISFSEIIDDTCTDCRIELRIKTAPDSGGSPGVWTSAWSGPDGEDSDEIDYYHIPGGERVHPDHDGDEWIKYRLDLFGDGLATPRLSEINIYYH